MSKDKNKEINDKLTKDIVWLAKKFEQYVFKGDIVTDKRMKELDNMVADAIAKGDQQRKETQEGMK
jgi:hypothetical protein